MEIKTVRHSRFADEYEGRAGLAKLPYKMLLQQSEVRNGQLLSEIDELKDTVAALQARVAELEDENAGLRVGLLKEYSKEVRREEMYQNIRRAMRGALEKSRQLQRINADLLVRVAKVEKV